MAEQKTYSIKIDGIEQNIKNVESLGSAVNTNVSSIKELRTALKATKDEMAGLDKNTKQWQDLAKVAGDYKDQIDDINQAASRFASDTKALDDAINIGQSMTSVFTLAQGAMSAFGLSTDGVVESIQKLQGAMAIIQSLQSLQNTLRGSTATTDLLSKSMKLMGLSMEGASKSTKILRLGLASIGIGLIIGLVMTLIEYWDDIKKAFTDTFPILKTLSEKFNGLEGVIQGVGQAIVHWLTNPIITLAKVFKKVFTGDFKGAIEEAKNGIINQFKGLKTAFFKGVEKSRQKVETEANNTSNSVVGKAKETADKVKEIREKMTSDWVDAEKKGLEEIKKIRDDEVKAEEQKQKKLKDLRDKNSDAEYKYQKARLENEKAYATTEEERIRIENELLELEKNHNLEIAKRESADALGMTVDELQSRIDNVEGRWVGLNDEQKQTLQTLLTQLATIETAADTTKKKLNESSGSTSSNSSSSGSDNKKEHTLTDSWHEFIYGGEGEQDKLSKKAQELADAVNTAYQETIAPVFDGVMNLGDAIHEAMEFAIEEAENALEEAEAMHDEAVDKVSESKDRISELNDKMKDSSGAQLEQYKQQMADEVLLLQQREQEEKRLQKEKEKREKELEQQKKKQRKLEMQQQLIQAIVSGALAVVNGFATQPFVPVGIAMGALAGVTTAIQIATISKQLSKLADGGLLQGKSHAQGGIPVGNTGIEVEGGEFVVSKRATAKYLPLLDAINAEGNGGKHVINNPKSMFADGGQLNYQRIDDNFNQLNGTAAIANAIGSIDFHPVVAITDINRGQKNLVEVRELAGASN